MVTFSTKKKLLTVGEHAVVDQEAIAHVIGLLASQRDLNFQEVLATELTAYHHLQYFMLMVMRVAAVKSTLKKNVQVYVSQRFIMSPTAIVYFVVDVLAVIWTLEWPTHGTVATFISGFKTWLSLQLTSMCFDRHRDYSIKNSSRSARATTSHVHYLTVTLTTPPSHTYHSIACSKTTPTRHG